MDNGDGSSDIYCLVSFELITSVHQENGLINGGVPQERLIFSCPEAVCRIPRLSIYGSMLTFERSSITEDDNFLFPQVVFIPINLQEGCQIEQSNQDQTNRFPNWSSEDYLAFYDETLGEYVFLNPLIKEKLRFENQTCESGTWNPFGMEYIAPEILFLEDIDQNSSTY